METNIESGGPRWANFHQLGGIGGGGGLIDDYVRWLQAGDVSPGTIRLRLCHLGRFAKQHEPLGATADDLVDWLQTPGWKPATRASYRSSLRSFYKWMVEAGHRPDDPTLKTRKIKVPATPPKAPPVSVLKDALATANQRDVLAVKLAAYAGLRRAEIAGLHADAIGERFLTIVGKGRKTRRVPIRPELTDDLAAARVRGGYLFPGADGVNPIQPDAMGRRLARLLPGKWSAHSLRHLFATEVYRASHDIRAVQELLGHASVATTQIYAGIDEDDLMAAVNCWAS